MSLETPRLPKGVHADATAPVQGSKKAITGHAEKHLHLVGLPTVLLIIANMKKHSWNQLRRQEGLVAVAHRRPEWTPAPAPLPR